jgi:hypothetical protein
VGTCLQHSYILIWTLLVLPLTMFDRPAEAYPNYISYGYGSCLTCHYNPAGNGPLTDYGRALSATEISDRLISKDSETEEQITDKSGFNFGQPPVEWLRPSLSYRSLYLKRNYDESSEKDSFIIMDLSATVVAKLLQKDKLTFVGQIGYSPKPRALEDDPDVVEYRSREHYVGYRFAKEFGVYAGLMDKVFGIRIPDHTAFSRSITGLGQNDQTHGILAHFSNKLVEVGVQPFIGNLVQDEDLRQKGVTTQIEFAAADKTRIGLSGLTSTSEYLDTLLYAGHARIGIGQGNSILTEIGQAEKTVKVNDVKTTSRYVMTQGHLHFRRGLWGLLTVENLKPNIDSGSTINRIGPGVQFFPFQRLEIRGDVYKTYRKTTGQPATDSIDLATQLHIWL